MSISSRMTTEGMGLMDKVKYAIKTRSYGWPFQLEDFVFYYLHPTSTGRQQSSLQSEFHNGHINIETLLTTPLDQFTLDGLQNYVQSKPDTFANFNMFAGSIINLKKLCDDLAKNKAKNEAKKKLEETELASTEAKLEETSNIDLITKNKYSVFEASSTTSYTTFNAIKCIWVIYELLKKKYNRETGQMTLEQVNNLFEGKIKTLIQKLQSRCTSLNTSAFTMTEYKDLLSIGDIVNYMGVRRGGKTRKRRMVRRRRCKTRSNAKNRR